MSLRQAKRTKTVAFSQATATDHVAISSKAGTRIAITGIWLRSTSTNTITLQKRAADNTTLTALSGAIPAAAAEWFRAEGSNESPVIAPLDKDEDFIITLGSAADAVGWITYTQETV